MSSSRPRHWHGPVPERPVVVGVEPGQPGHVLAEAGELAERLGTGLVCVWVDPSRVRVADGPAGLETTPLDPDQDDDPALEPDREMGLEVAAAMASATVPWRFVFTVGEVAHGLARVADEHDAVLLVVGARRRSVVAWAEQLLGGSVGARLVHSQHRPVVVVPHPRTAG